MAADSDLPNHLAAIARTIAELHAEHHRQASLLQRLVTALTSSLARPVTVCLLTAMLAVWIIGNAVLWRMGHDVPDPPPFAHLQVGASVAALYMTLLILAAQRHDDALADRREQLMLQLTMVSEQKLAKVIQLLEELRRDDPLLANRHDREAAAMAKPANPVDVLKAVKGPGQSPARAEGP